VCESDEELLEVLSGRIRTLPGVRSTETFVYLRLRKQTYSWGVR
jgi:Lrp/AsnC family transcriptional regulator, regulator for asnA, asnC and gidA